MISLCQFLCIKLVANSVCSQVTKMSHLLRLNCTTRFNNSPSQSPNTTSQSLLYKPRVRCPFASSNLHQAHFSHAQFNQACSPSRPTLSGNYKPMRRKSNLVIPEHVSYQNAATRPHDSCSSMQLNTNNQSTTSDIACRTRNDVSTRPLPKFLSQELSIRQILNYSAPAFVPRQASTAFSSFSASSTCSVKVNSLEDKTHLTVGTCVPCSAVNSHSEVDTCEAIRREILSRVKTAVGCTDKENVPISDIRNAVNDRHPAFSPSTFVGGACNRFVLRDSGLHGYERKLTSDDAEANKENDDGGLAQYNDRRDSPTSTDESRGIKRHPELVEHVHEMKKSRPPPLCSSSSLSLRYMSTGPPGLRPMGDVVKTLDCDNITRAIAHHYETFAQKTDLYGRKMRLRDALFSVMKDIFPKCGLYAIGSSMNGFGSRHSDMDLCLMISHSEIDQRREAMDILKNLRRKLTRCNYLKKIELIEARVPILKLTDKVSGVECDLNINNSVGIRNTHLLKSYASMDARLAPLVLFVKHWARIQGINDASQGTISSYSLTLMVIHYLQYGCTPRALPSLQAKYPHKYSDAIEIRCLTLNDRLAPFTSSNKMSVGQLFHGFLHYFANFDFSTCGISIRCGGIIPVLKLRQTPDKISLNQWKLISIEEPFNLSNTAYSVFDESNFRLIVHVFEQSYRILERTGDVNVLLRQLL